jgi:aspartyl-tRNA(Asn)/glutamyl-tRNA(Gln) amidotransferase subunit B
MSKQYYPVIGLEIHAELNTKSKMFCACKNDPNEETPNVNICPICMAHPGTLPVPNKEAIKKVMMVGVALGSDVANFTEFDRKNYFYPDIPKGYQISQYKYPIVRHGALNGFDITRIHLEEDTGLSKHDRGNYSLVDYNRAGVPLMELVTEPVIHSAKDAADFARELQTLLRTLGVSDANLEKGEMRVEPNISISDTEGVFGTKVEVKNLNSFKSVEKAIEYELARMQALYEAGRQDEIVQETRGWDEAKQTTFSQRSKENANDYRYFPDPDIPKFYLHELFSLDELRASLPELPWEKRERYQKIWAHYFENKDSVSWDKGEMEKTIEFFIREDKYATYLEELIKQYGGIQKINIDLADAINIFINLLVPQINENNLGDYFGFLVPEKLKLIQELKSSEQITSKGVKVLVEEAFKSNIEIVSFAKENGLFQQNDPEALRAIARSIIASQEKIVADYRGGKESAVQALVGFMMKETKGSANPSVALEVLKEELSK